MPLAVLRRCPHGRRRRTRGHRGSLLLRCKALSSSSSCRFIPAHPRFLGNPPVHAPLYDPGGTAAPDHRALALPLQHDDVAFRYFDGVGSYDTLFSGLNHAAYTLAVYAAQPPSPTVHARLAPGWWSSLAGRGSNPLGPFVKCQPCPLHGILLTQAFPGAPKSRLSTPSESMRAVEGQSSVVTYKHVPQDPEVLAGCIPFFGMISCGGPNVCSR